MRRKGHIRHFITETEDGNIHDVDFAFPTITTAERQRRCRGVFYDSHNRQWTYCKRFIGKGIKNLTIEGKTGLRRANYHHYCPRCAKVLIENMKKVLDKKYKEMDIEETSKKNKKDIRKSNHIWIWEKVFH